MTQHILVVFETGDGPYDPENHQYSDSVIALSGTDLQLSDYYTPANRAWITKKDLDMGNMSPVVFPFKQWELVAAAGKEGVIYLLDAKSMGGPDHHTPLYRSPLLANEDVNLAGRMNGVQLARIAKERNPRLDVVVTSARPLPEPLPAGAKFWAKPWAALDVLREAEEAQLMAARMSQR